MSARPEGNYHLNRSAEGCQAERAVTRIGQVMTRKLYLIGPEEEASAAMKMMNDMQIRRTCL